jgi:hypothetical protein
LFSSPHTNPSLILPPFSLHHVLSLTQAGASFTLSAVHLAVRSFIIAADQISLYDSADQLTTDPTITTTTHPIHSLLGLLNTLE